MAGSKAVEVVRSWKIKLIDALIADPDCILQYTDMHSIITWREYRRIKAISDPSLQIRDLLDCVIGKGQSFCLRFLEVLKQEDVQSTYPKLSFVKEVKLEEQKNEVAGNTLTLLDPPDYDLPVSSKQKVITVDGLTLNGPLHDNKAGELFVEEAFQIIMDEVVKKGCNVKEKVCEWKDPEMLRDLLDLELGDSNEPHEKLLQLCRDVARFSVKTNHPRFFNQLFAGLDHHALVGRFLSDSLNTSQYTYEVGPVFVLMEEVVLTKLRAIIGWNSGDGIFCPGGSISTMYAMNLARYRAFPEVKVRGLWSLPRLALFTSQECHYSVKKSACFLGIGLENVLLVDVDDRGIMIVEDLVKKIEKAKSEGIFPFMVSATSGSTVFGAFDPLDEIADVCQKYQLWFHVDNLLKQCHSANATYLFQQDKFYDISYDTGDKSIQCGRKVDCLKLWLMWKARGTRGLEERVDRAFTYTRYLVDEMKKREGFQLLLEVSKSAFPQFVNICFWYIPPSLRGQQGQEGYEEKLSKVAPIVKERMIKKGSMMVGYQPRGSQVNFFRMVVISPQITREDLDFFLDEIESLASDLTTQIDLLIFYLPFFWAVAPMATFEYREKKQNTNPHLFCFFSRYPNVAIGATAHLPSCLPACGKVIPDGGSQESWERGVLSSEQRFSRGMAKWGGSLMEEVSRTLKISKPNYVISSTVKP
ncbi:GADL1 decarboxylase, partial [Polypterus senegalus]